MVYLKICTQADLKTIKKYESNILRFHIQNRNLVKLVPKLKSHYKNLTTSQLENSKYKQDTETGSSNSNLDLDKYYFPVFKCCEIHMKTWPEILRIWALI